MLGKNLSVLLHMALCAGQPTGFFALRIWTEVLPSDLQAPPRHLTTPNSFKFMATLGRSGTLVLLLNHQAPLQEFLRLRVVSELFAYIAQAVQPRPTSKCVAPNCCSSTLIAAHPAVPSPSGIPADLDKHGQECLVSFRVFWQVVLLLDLQAALEKRPLLSGTLRTD